MDEFLVYRVVAVFDDIDSASNVVSLTCHTYCSPNTIFWLSDDGLEDPNCTCIILIIVHVITDHLYRVEFEYDDGKYIGTLSEHDELNRFGHKFTATIKDISSL